MRTFPGGCWVKKRDRTGGGGASTSADGETTHSSFTLPGFCFLHGLQTLVLLVEHPQVLRAAGLKNTSAEDVTDGTS